MLVIKNNRNCHIFRAIDAMSSVMPAMVRHNYYQIIIGNVFYSFLNEVKTALNRSFQANSAITSVPAVIKTKPKIDFIVSFSFKNTAEKIIVIKMLILSIGTTTLTTPCLIAQK